MNRYLNQKRVMSSVNSKYMADSINYRNGSLGGEEFRSRRQQNDELENEDGSNMQKTNNFN